MEPIKFNCPTMGEAEAEAVREVINGGWIVGGPRLTAFEEAFRALCQSSNAVGVTSWTTGAFLVLHAWNIGPGDEVIVPSYSFIATANVVRHCGARVVFADIQPDTWNIDPSDVEAKLTSRTKAIIPVDQLGLPCDMRALSEIARRHGLRILQDSACAIGSQYDGAPIGQLADASVFSLHARKLISCGEGGMIVTNDGALAARLRTLQHQGASLPDHVRHASNSTVHESYEEVGFNFRLTDIQAAIGLVQLTRLQEILEQRRTQAMRYQDFFEASDCFQAPVETGDVVCNWQSYMVGIAADAPFDREALMRFLDDRGVPTRRSVMASHLEPAYGGKTGTLPVTETAFVRNLLLPVYHTMTPVQQGYILDALARSVRTLA